MAVNKIMPFTNEHETDLSNLHGNTPSNAVGDGVADDTAALATWLNSGPNLYLPSGTYKVGSQLLSNATRSNVTITCSQNAVIVPIATFDQSTSVFRLENITNLTIDGLHIQGNGAIASPALVANSVDIYGVRMHTCANVLVKNCKFPDMPKGGILGQSCTNVRVLNNDVFRAYNFAMWFNQCTSVTVSKNNVSGHGAEQHDATTLGEAVGILFSETNKVLCEGNTINNFKNTGTKSEGGDYIIYLSNTVTNCGKDMIKVQGLVGNTVKYARIVNNTTEFMRPWQTNDGWMHVQIWDCEDFVVAGNICKGGVKGTSVGGGETGVWAYATEAGFITKRGVIANNVITDMGFHGVYLGNVSNVSVNHNTITNWAKDAPDSKGILVETGNNIIISGNTIEQTTQPAGGASNGIKFTGTNSKIINNIVNRVKDVGIISALTACDYFEVSGNTVQGGGAQGIYTSATGTIKSAKYNGNDIIDCGTSFTYAIDFGTNGATFSALSISNNSIFNTAWDQSWIRTWGAGTVSKFYAFNNTIGGAALETPTFTMTPAIIIIDGKYRGTGSPEGVIAAPIGAEYIASGGGASTTLYVKTSGTGNTGWTAK